MKVLKILLILNNLFLEFLHLRLEIPLIVKQTSNHFLFYCCSRIRVSSRSYVFVEAEIVILIAVPFFNLFIDFVLEVSFSTSTTKRPALIQRPTSTTSQSITVDSLPPYSPPEGNHSHCATVTKELKESLF